MQSQLTFSSHQTCCKSVPKWEGTVCNLCSLFTKAIINLTSFITKEIVFSYVFQGKYTFKKIKIKYFRMLNKDVLKEFQLGKFRLLNKVQSKILFGFRPTAFLFDRKLDIFSFTLEFCSSMLYSLKRLTRFWLVYGDWNPLPACVDVLYLTEILIFWIMIY